MATGGSGAVFFLGTRAHYQVLNQPESHYDVENGNASTETIYQNPSVQELWPRDQNSSASPGQDMWPREQKLDVENERWSYCNQTEVTITDEREKPDNAKRFRRRTSEIALCEKDDMTPAILNSTGDSTPQKKCGKVPLLTFLWGLARRKRKLDTDDAQYLRDIDTALSSCTYRESCRCLDCQSRYFECDDSDEEYSSDDSFVPRYVAQMMEANGQHQLQLEDDDDDDDDEVFIDSIPDDNTSTDLLLETKMSVSSDDMTAEEAEHKLQLEVAAGTPIFLNYLLTHPITCAIQ